MILLSKQQLIAIHDQIVLATGGTTGIRDEGLLDAAIAAATKNIDKSVYVLEIFLVHRARSRHPERQATNVCIALQRRWPHTPCFRKEASLFPTSHRYIYRNLCY